MFFTLFNLQIYQNRYSLLTGTNAGNKEIKYSAIVRDDKIFINTYKGEKEIFIKGVNIGLGKPGYYPGDIGILKNEYLKWFYQISEMGIDFIRVYTLQSPEFYQALFEYNKYIKEPLYLIQGAYVNEALIEEKRDMWNKALYEDFSNEVKNVIDGVHGNGEIKFIKGHASGKYTYDVSPYVVSYLLGIEFDGETVLNTNQNNADKNSFKGEYLYTLEGGKPFEAMLASIGDFAIGYETEKYRKQTIIAFSNWPTTDPLQHPNEPEEKNNIDGIDVEYIESTENFIPGMYASYHVYPYYPDFLNFEDQMQFVDENELTNEEYIKMKNSNSYRQYLYRLNQHHKGPVVITEFGVATSRGVTHEDLSRGFNQGGISEEDQGEMIISMLEDIKEAGLNGGVIFSWQDEWFKRTWNTMELNTDEGRIRWHDVQTSEQNFGIMAFEPAVMEFKNEPILKVKGYNVFVSHDPEYLRLAIEKENIKLENEKIRIFIDTKVGKGNEFIIELDGKNNSRIKVRKDYDAFAFLFSKQLNFESDEEYRKINLRLRNRIYLPQSQITKEPSYYETGKLSYGDKNGDFIQKDDKIEIKIPWLVINFSDPSTKKVIGDLENASIGYIPGSELPYIYTEGVGIGLSIGDSIGEGNIVYGKYTWNEWEQPIYEERLKSSYSILKNAFKESVEED